MMEQNQNRTINIQLPSLFPWQQDVFDGVFSKGKGMTHVVRSRRQCGKSMLLELLLIAEAVKNPKSTNYELSPTFPQADKIYSELVDLIKDTPLFKKKNDMKRSVTFSNGSFIQCFSAEQGENLRGYTCTGILCVDECCIITDETFYYVTPWCNVHRCPIILFSTPKSKQGFFYQFDMLGVNGNNKVCSYDWTKYDCSALLDNETIEFYRQSLPRLQFMNEYLGLYSDNVAAVFGNYGDVLKADPIKKGKLYAGIDWGSGTDQDMTSISIFDEDRQMIHLSYWNDLDETETIDKLVAILKDYNVYKCTVETNSIGTVFKGLLDKAIKAAGLSTILTGFTTTNDSKNKLINNLQVKIQKKECTLLPDKELMRQLDGYEVKVNSNGKYIYGNGKMCKHDDTIMSTAIGLYSIEKGNYTVSVL